MEEICVKSVYIIRLSNSGPLPSGIFHLLSRDPGSFVCFRWSKQQQVFAKLVFIPNTLLHNSGLSLGQNLGERKGI